MRTARSTAYIAAALAGLALAPAGVQAQDFMFGAPNGSIGIRFGASLFHADSEIFHFTREHLTVEEGDFHAPVFAVDAAFRVAPRLDLVASAGYGEAAARSEFRDFVDLDDQPIEQTTRFSTLPLGLTAKGYLLPTGRSVGTLAWMPASFAPYLGAGVGAVYYRFAQEGDFVDQLDEDLPVFYDEIASSGWAPMVHAAAGADIGLSTRAKLTMEARYTRASAAMGADFRDFDDIDLSGLQTTIGVAWRF